MSVDDASAALREIRYGLVIVGTQGEAGPHFMIANWGTQASFDPWRYVIMIKRTARTLANLQREGAFTINLLSQGNDAFVRDLMKRKGDGVGAEKGALAAPRLAQAFAGFDCRLLDVRDIGGDHMLVVAEMIDGWKAGDGPALTLRELDLSYAG